MQKLNISLDKKSLLDLLKNYYELSKIRTVLFDEHHNKLIEYPTNDCAFCKLMKSKSNTKKLCDESDKISFEIVKRKKELVIYHCHAGLVEACSPLIQDGIVIGYIMFGQITDEPNNEKLINHIYELLDKYDLTFDEYTTKIKYRNENQIKAAAKLLETCTFYVLLKDYIKLSNETFINNLNNFIDKNIEKDISIYDLTKYFNVSKTKLYQLFNEQYSCGIANYIKLRKIEKSKEFLQKTNLKVSEISKLVGFNDSNYFCRTFKKIVGMSANKYRHK